MSLRSPRSPFKGAWRREKKETKAGFLAARLRHLSQPDFVSRPHFRNHIVSCFLVIRSYFQLIRSYVFFFFSFLQSTCLDHNYSTLCIGDWNYFVLECPISLTQFRLLTVAAGYTRLRHHTFFFCDSFRTPPQKKTKQ